MNAEIRQTDAEGNPQGENINGELSENDFYLFDAEAVSALSCAIEEIALEEARGEFLAAIQDFHHFDSLKERYWQLAATLDDVQVIGTGQTPRRNGHVKFCNSGNSALKSFWLILYKGASSQILLLCEQANEARSLEERKFIGFYTFNPRVVNQAREDVADLLCGKCPDLRQFSRLHKLDLAAKKLKIEFTREQEALELAIRKLKDHSEKYDSEHFIRDVDKTLERLTELKSRLPELIVGH